MTAGSAAVAGGGAAGAFASDAVAGTAGAAAARAGEDAAVQRAHEVDIASQALMILVRLTAHAGALPHIPITLAVYGFKSHGIRVTWLERGRQLRVPG